MKIRCNTLFDITNTGVTGHYRPSLIPFVDRAKQDIRNQSDWHRARNQQRNWETLTQLISLRTQVEISTPVKHDKMWTFDFEIDSDDIFRNNDDPLALLKIDCNNVPMLSGLGEDNIATGLLITQGKDINCWFELNIESGEKTNG